jgi:hypothetical protein
MCKIFNLYPDKQEIYSIIIYIFAHQKIIINQNQQV